MGRDLSPITNINANIEAKPTFAESWNWKMVRFQNLKLIVRGFLQKSAELYDLIKDPYEMTNEVANPLYRTQVKKLHDMICNWQKWAKNHKSK